MNGSLNQLIRAQCVILDHLDFKLSLSHQLFHLTQQLTSAVKRLLYFAPREAAAAAFGTPREGVRARGRGGSTSGQRELVPDTQESGAGRGKEIEI